MFFLVVFRRTVTAVAQPEWRRRGHAPPETNLLRFLLVLCINFQLLEWRQWLTISLIGPSRKQCSAALLSDRCRSGTQTLRCGCGLVERAGLGLPDAFRKNTGHFVNSAGSKLCRSS